MVVVVVMEHTCVCVCVCARMCVCAYCCLGTRTVRTVVEAQRPEAEGTAGGAGVCKLVVYVRNCVWCGAQLCAMFVEFKAQKNSELGGQLEDQVGWFDMTRHSRYWESEAAVVLLLLPGTRCALVMQDVLAEHCSMHIASHTRIHARSHAGGVCGGSERVSRETRGPLEGGG